MVHIGNSGLDFKRIYIRRSPAPGKETIEMRPPRSIVTGLLAGVLASLLFAGAASALEVGQKAPDFTLNGTDGKPVKLSDLTAKGPIVLYTFIAAFTST
jgi:hypothetical protein